MKPIFKVLMKINLPKLINIHRYMIEEYKTKFFEFFWKPCYPLKAPNAPKIQKIQKIDFKLENMSSDNTKP